MLRTFMAVLTSQAAKPKRRSLEDYIGKEVRRGGYGCMPWG
jgi:hypothetical protein